MNSILKLSICECCKQVITEKTKGSLEHHTDTIKRLYGFSLDDLKVHNKMSHLVYARQHFWLLLCMESEWSYTRIGHITDHQYTSVMYGIRMISNNFFNTPKKAPLYDMCKAYWLAVGLTEEEANAKAKKRTNN